MATDQALITSAVNPAVSEAMEVFARIAAVRNVLAPDLNDQELQLFAMVAQRSGLDPFAKQIYAIKRGGRVTFQTGIDGLRSGAERTKAYGGSDEPEFGPACGCGKGPAGHPEWARVVVYRIRDGARVGQSATAWYHEYAIPGDMWTKMPRNQLAKCAEALALRKAFPFVLSDVYAAEEMDQAGGPENPAAVAAAAQPTARERLAARRAALEAPAVPDQAATAEEGAFRDVDATPEAPAAPEPAAAAVPARCTARSPYGEASEPCARESGHPGVHKNHDRESWEGAAA